MYVQLEYSPTQYVFYANTYCWINLMEGTFNDIDTKSATRFLGILVASHLLSLDYIWSLIQFDSTISLTAAAVTGPSP